MTVKIGCVVLASGDSVRFGENKLMASFRGKPMLLCTLEELPRSFAKTLVVTRSREVEALAKGAGFAVLLHRLPDISDTIRLGLEQMGDMDGCMFCVGDQPLCSGETMGRMMEALEGHPKSIVRACYGGRDGNPALFAKVFFSELLALHEGQSGGAVMQRHPDQIVRVEAANEWELMDADTPLALEALENMQTSHPGL